MGGQWSRYGTLVAAAAAFLGGAIEEANKAPGSNTGTVMYTAGLILLGVWITLEINYLLGNRNSNKDTDEE
jgi:hypothetical protein